MPLPYTTYNLGHADGLFVPSYTSLHPSAVIVGEGPWTSIALTWDAWDYGNRDFVSVSVLSAHVRPVTIARTLDLLFPGVPRFSIFDQNLAGIRLRERTLDIAKPITVSGAGSGNDYRDLIPGIRFERLVEVVLRELKQLEDGR